MANIDPGILNNTLADLATQTMAPILRLGFMAPAGRSLPQPKNFDIVVGFGIQKLYEPMYHLGAAGALAKAAINETARNFTLAAAEAHRMTVLDIIRHGHDDIEPNRGMYGELKKMGLLRVIKTSRPGQIIDAGGVGEHTLAPITGELEAGITDAEVSKRDAIADAGGEVGTNIIYDKPEYITAIVEGHRSTIPRSPELSAYYGQMRKELGLEGIPRPNPRVPPRPFFAIADAEISGQLGNIWTDLVNVLEEDLRNIFNLKPGQRTPDELVRIILGLRQNRLITFQQRNTNTVVVAVNGAMRRVLRGNAEVAITEPFFEGKYGKEIEDALTRAGGARGDSIQTGVRLGAGGGLGAGGSTGGVPGSVAANVQAAASRKAEFANVPIEDIPSSASELIARQAGRAMRRRL